MKKHYYVAWECRMSSDLDDLALQGPHNIERAKELLNDFHSVGMKATIINASATMSNGQKVIVELVNQLESLLFCAKKGLLKPETDFSYIESVLKSAKTILEE